MDRLRAYQQQALVYLRALEPSGWIIAALVAAVLVLLWRTWRQGRAIKRLSENNRTIESLIDLHKQSITVVGETNKCSMEAIQRTVRAFMASKPQAAQEFLKLPVVDTPPSPQ